MTWTIRPFLFSLFYAVLSTAILAPTSLADSDLIFDTGESTSNISSTGNKTIYYPTPAVRPNKKQYQYYESRELSDLPPNIKLTPRRLGYQGNDAAHVGKAATRSFWKALLPGIPARYLPR